MIDLQKHIEQKLESIDIEHVVCEEIREQIRGEIATEIRKAIATEAQAIIGNEIHKALSKEVNTDDGWGKKEHFDSFEDLFKSVLNERMNAKWDMHKIIKTEVTNRVDALMSKNMNDVVKKIAENICKNGGGKNDE